jgi:hypothetical protein
VVVKIALVAFLVIAAGIVVVTFIRKSRAKGFPAPESSSHFWQAEGSMPPTPKPEWVNWTDEAGDGGSDRDQPRR